MQPATDPMNWILFMYLYIILSVLECVYGCGQRLWIYAHFAHSRHSMHSKCNFIHCAPLQAYICAMCMCTACSTRIPFTVRLPQRVPSQQTLQLAVSEYIVHFRNGIRDLNVVRSLHQQHAAMWATDISSLCHGKGRQEKKHKKMKQICVYGKHWFCVECVWRGSEGIAMLYGLLVLAFRMLSTVFL